MLKTLRYTLINFAPTLLLYDLVRPLEMLKSWRGGLMFALVIFHQPHRLLGCAPLKLKRGQSKHEH
jgi:hypothetical protein